MRSVQFATLRKLRQLYEAHGICGSFNVEVMQQLAHRREGERCPELNDLALEWEELVRETHARGHDIQLHVHPQWSSAAYDKGRWTLSGDWSILNYSPGEIRSLIGESKGYLESVLRPVNPAYRCVSFRSGSWCLAPNEHLLPILVELGIQVDISIVEGLHYVPPPVALDYRQLEEPFLPFYPAMGDARKVAHGAGPLVCVPTHSFSFSKFYRVVAPFAVRLARFPIPFLQQIGFDYVRRPNDTPIPNAGYRADPSKGVWSQPERAQEPGRRVSDLAGMSWAEMREMLRDIRKRSAACNEPVIPIVLENHTKDVGNFEPIERFLNRLADMPGSRVITLTELSDNLRSNLYPIRSRTS